MLKNLFVLFALLLLITACQSKDQEGLKSVDVDPPVQAEITPEEQLKDLFLHNLRTDMSENEVRELFGGSFSLVQNAMEGNETWRYDLGAQKGYEFDDQGIDQVDMEGIMQGQVQQQLFVDWSVDGKLESAALYMTSKEEDGLMEYYLYSDDTREEKFTPFH